MELIISMHENDNFMHEKDISMHENKNLAPNSQGYPLLYDSIFTYKMTLPDQCKNIYIWEHLLINAS